MSKVQMILGCAALGLWGTGLALELADLEFFSRMAFGTSCVVAVLGIVESRSGKKSALRTLAAVVPLLLFLAYPTPVIIRDAVSAVLAPGDTD